MSVVSNGGLYDSGTYIPFKCEIASITQADQAVVTLTVSHGWVVGNTVSFSIPKEYGMRQIDRQTAIVLAVTDDTVTVNINTTFYDPFVIPVVSSLTVLSPPLLMPVGDQNIGYQVTNVNAPALQIPGTFRNTFP